MAVVKELRGLKYRFGGSDRAGWLPSSAAPKEEETILDLQIVQEGNSFYLQSESRNPHFRGGDTWHQSIEEALAQAQYQFGVKPSDWSSVT